MKIFRSLYFYVLLAIATGVVLGIAAPAFAEQLKPLSDGFIKLIRMMIVPIIFLTVVNGISGMQDMKQAGRAGIKALLYFEVLTTIALILGLVIVNLLKPGAGVNANAALLDTSAVNNYIVAGNETPKKFVDFLLHIIPDNIIGAFAEGNILQVLFFAILFGVGLSSIKEKAAPVLNAFHAIQEALFALMNFIMKLAPLGALGAMSYTVAKFGIGSLTSLLKLMGCFYATCLLFIFVILGIILRMFGYNIVKLLKFIGGELLIVLGTSSSESALPALMHKMKKLGCSKEITQLVIPTGYSFNLDGTCIYLTMAAVFITQCLNISLNFSEQLYMMLVLLLTSKGAAGVTGAGFITLAATLPLIENIPAASVVLIFGIDRIMSEARALTNIIGNAVATIVIAKWEKQIDDGTAGKIIG